MKKIISLIMCVLFMLTIPMSAFAGGYGSNVGFEEDNLDDTPFNPYIVTRLDFENASGTTATPENTTDSTKFGLYNTGDSEHGMVYMIEPAGYAAVSNGNTGITYKYSDETYTAFNEPLEADSYYIFSYEYKNVLTENSNASAAKYFSFAPMVETYIYNDTDWKDFPTPSIDTWSTRTGIFYSGNKTSFSVKINTEGSQTYTYIDNFSIIKLAKINLSSPNAVKLDTDGTGIIYNDAMNSYFALMGEPVTIRVLNVGAGESVTNVTHNEKVVDKKNDSFYINFVKDEIDVEFSFSKADFETFDGVVADSNNLYIQMGRTLPQVIGKWGISTDNIDFKNNDGVIITNLVSPVISGSSFALNYDGEIKAEYTLKYLGDANIDDIISVSDILSLVDTVLERDYINYADIDINGICNVSDIVLLRKTILYPPSIEALPQKFRVLGIGNSFSVDGMEYLYDVAKAYGYEDEDILLGNLYIGGCSLKTHWNNAEADLAKYQYNYYNTATKSWKYSKDLTLLNGLTDEDWDYISLQQVSQYSGQPDTFSPYLKNLIDYINANKTNADAKIIWHSTWAYAKNSSHEGFVNYNNDQDTMYNAVLDASNHILSNYSADIQKITPSGTAIQNMRHVVGDYMTRDGYHLNLNYGRLTASLTWFKAITGANLDSLVDNAKLLQICSNGLEDLTLNGVNITASELLENCIASADAAVKNPYAVTDIKKPF